MVIDEEMTLKKLEVFLTFMRMNDRVAADSSDKTIKHSSRIAFAGGKKSPCPSSNMSQQPDTAATRIRSPTTRSGYSTRCEEGVRKVP